MHWCRGGSLVAMATARWRTELVSALHYGGTDCKINLKMPIVCMISVFLIFLLYFLRILTFKEDTLLDHLLFSIWVPKMILLLTDLKKVEILNSFFFSFCVYVTQNVKSYVKSWQIDSNRIPQTFKVSFLR